VSDTADLKDAKALLVGEFQSVVQLPLPATH
jgi:hypothetical protein